MSSPSIRRAQDYVASAFGLSPEARQQVVHAALDRGTRDSAIYWLQLFLAMTIATLGLVLGSTAVVIGAMLVSPLMSPIVELGLGLAVGSPLLVLRSVVRTTASIVAVIVIAALLTLMLPFHEVTSEIAARTSPTALDLLVAVCCALAAAYTQLRVGSDTAATAAGTAIGIALVPPLCVSGYGVGTRSLEIASGALMLFTANLSAIVVVTTASFVVLGFDAVEVREREHEVLGRAERVTVAVRAARLLERVFSGRSGTWLRLGMPLLFLGAIYVPLQRALREVTWEVRVRSAVQKKIEGLSVRSVGTNLVVKHHAVQLGLVVVGTPAEAAELQRRLELEITAVAGVQPRIEVLAVAEASQLPPPAVPRPEVIAPPPRPAAKTLRAQLDDVLRANLPIDATFRLVASSVSLDDKGRARVVVVHTGARLGPIAAGMLAARFSASFGVEVDVDEVTLEDRRVLTDLPSFILAGVDALTAASRYQGLAVCLTGPAGLEREPAVLPLLSRLSPESGSSLVQDEHLSVWLSDRPCPAPVVVADAGAGDSAGDAAVGDAHDGAP